MEVLDHCPHVQPETADNAPLGRRRGSLEHVGESVKAVKITP